MRQIPQPNDRRPVCHRATLIALALSVVAGCDDTEKDREPLPDWSEGYDIGRFDIDAGPSDSGAGSDSDSGVVRHPDVPPGHFALAIPEDTPYPIRLRRTGSNNAPCSFPAAGERNEITCTLDMDELDLWVLGLKYDVVVPEGMCDFLYYRSYMYANWKVGPGPSEVSYTKHADGTYSDEVNSENGRAVCDFDYTDRYSAAFDAPNCCQGGYSLTITSAESGESSTSSHQWGGDSSGCYYGAAFLDKEAVFTSDGFPTGKFLYVNREGLNKTIEYEGLSDKYASNVALANHWDPSEHDGMPAALRADRASPYYEFLCLDDADEILGHIRLVVREWNEEVEFDKDGNPDSEGTETGWGTPLNDITDWADLTPGDDTFPSLPTSL